jgi:hypothetical protein
MKRRRGVNPKALSAKSINTALVALKAGGEHQNSTACCSATRPVTSSRFWPKFLLGSSPSICQKWQDDSRSGVEYSFRSTKILDDKKCSSHQRMWMGACFDVRRIGGFTHNRIGRDAHVEFRLASRLSIAASSSASEANPILMASDSARIAPERFLGLCRSWGIPSDCHSHLV